MKFNTIWKIVSCSTIMKVVWVTHEDVLVKSIRSVWQFLLIFFPSWDWFRITECSLRSYNDEKQNKLILLVCYTHRSWEEKLLCFLSRLHTWNSTTLRYDWLWWTIRRWCLLLEDVFFVVVFFFFSCSSSNNYSLGSNLIRREFIYIYTQNFYFRIEAPGEMCH